ncbi:MAG: glutamine synthetase family protein [Chloroflexota bacterium]
MTRDAAGGEPLLFIGTCDLAAITRGRTIRGETAAHRARTGVGWVPANLGLTTFGPIATPNPFGTLGDLRLVPVEATRVRLPAHGDRPPLDVVLGDLVHPDGWPWSCDPRRALLDAVAHLEERTGLRLKVAFEQELQLEGLGSSGAPFSIEALRAAEPFGTRLVQVLHDNGLAPETWLPEYGHGQYELTMEPADPVIAADRAILSRVIIRDLAAAHGLRAVFSPVVRPDAVGNGTHIHLSLWDAHDRPVTLDPQTLELSDLAGRFAAGVLAHAPALIGWTASSVISSIRLQPGRWSAGAAFVGRQNREALLRLCPLPSVAGGRPPLEAANLEFRAVDATANPWLALAALIRAGADGLERGLPTPPVVDGEVEALSPEERERLRIVPLPAGQLAALAALEADEAARGWFAGDLVTTHLAVRRSERQQLAGASPEEACRRYAAVI